MDVVIIEDEYLLSEELQEKLHSINPDINVVAKLESVKESVEWFSNNVCDLIFLDVHLSDGISFSIFDEVNIDIPVIFTTAYDHYAIKAFDVNSIAYILKPIKDDELQKALNKLSVKIDVPAFDYTMLKQLLSPNIKHYKERFILSMGKLQKPVAVEDIAYFMADDKYLFAIVKTGEKFFCDFTLSRLEDELNPNDFYRVNRKFFVSFAAVKELIPYSKSRIKLKLSPETEGDVIISSIKAKEFKEWLEK